MKVHNTSPASIKTAKLVRKRARDYRFIPLGFFAFFAVSAVYITFDRTFDAGTKKIETSPNCCEPPSLDSSPKEIVGRLGSQFNLSDPLVQKYARLSHKYLEPWRANSDTNFYGTQKYVTGGIRPETLQYISSLWRFMACCGHVRIVNGTLYYRFGGFYTVWYRQLRFLQSLKLIQDAVHTFGLHDLTVEFFINTCDAPLSLFSDHWAGRGGFPVLSTVVTSDTMDIGIPDPLDLSPSYTPDLSLQVKWKKKKVKAVFRGATTNFDMMSGNWGANPRVRIHKISDANSDILDSRIHRWSHIKAEEIPKIEQDEVILAKYMNFTTFNAYKYQVVVDGGGGSCRICGVLRSNQLTIRQQTPAFQFYEPLLKDGGHMLLVSRTFSDLSSKVKWARTHDTEVRDIVRRANAMADDACTWRGRMTYWGILLVKYQDVLLDVGQIKPPTNFCTSKPPLEVMKIPQPTMSCKSPDVKKLQHHPCIFFCGGQAMKLDSFIWLKADTLAPVRRVGPGHEEFDSLG